MTRIKQFFKSALQKLKKKGIWWLLYFACTWIVPLILINEKYVFFDTDAHEIRFTAIGVTVGVALIFCFRKFLWRKVTVMKPNVWKWALLTLNRALPYGILVAACYMIIHHTDTVITLLWQVGISMLLGVVFEFVYIFQQRVEQAEELNTAIDARIEEGEEDGATE